METRTSPQFVAKNIINHDRVNRGTVQMFVNMDWLPSAQNMNMGPGWGMATETLQLGCK